MALIVLPQALRLVIPAIVGQFIALFMDTTLAVIVGLLELLAVGRAVLEINVTEANTTHPSVEDIIICRDVHKWFDDFHVLPGISLTIKRQEVVVICGPSGSGKSTFIRTINRLEEHQRGDIIVDGIELSHDIRNIEAIRREVGMVFQQFNLFPHLTVLQNVTLAPMWARKWPKARAEETAMQLLERVGIPEQALKYPAQLSGGQCRVYTHIDIKSAKFATVLPRNRLILVPFAEDLIPLDWQLGKILITNIYSLDLTG